MHKEIVDFINNFKKMDKNSIEDIFLNGNCYWFAQILMSRFSSYNPELYYLPIDCHFVTKICNKYYDISGEVIVSTVIESWDDLKLNEPNLADRVYRNCALFID